MVEKVDKREIKEITSDPQLQEILKSFGNEDNVIERNEIDANHDGYLDCVGYLPIVKDALLNKIQNALLNAGLIDKIRQDICSEPSKNETGISGLEIINQYHDPLSELAAEMGLSETVPWTGINCKAGHEPDTCKAVLNAIGAGEYRPISDYSITAFTGNMPMITVAERSENGQAFTIYTAVKGALNIFDVAGRRIVGWVPLSDQNLQKAIDILTKAK